MNNENLEEIKRRQEDAIELNEDTLSAFLERKENNDDKVRTDLNNLHTEEMNEHFTLALERYLEDNRRKVARTKEEERKRVAKVRANRKKRKRNAKKTHRRK